MPRSVCGGGDRRLDASTKEMGPRAETPVKSWSIGGRRAGKLPTWKVDCVRSKKWRVRRTERISHEEWGVQTSRFQLGYVAVGFQISEEKKNYLRNVSGAMG